MTARPLRRHALRFDRQAPGATPDGRASAGYVCRVAVTVVAPNMMTEFGLTQTQMGTVFSAFLVGYTLFQVPSGSLADRVSARRIFWCFARDGRLLTAFTALVGWRGFGLAMVIPQLWLIRAMFGVIAAPTYPTSGRTIAITDTPALAGPGKQPGAG